MFNSFNVLTPVFIFNNLLLKSKKKQKNLNFKIKRLNFSNNTNFFKYFNILSINSIKPKNLDNVNFYYFDKNYFFYLNNSNKFLLKNFFNVIKTIIEKNKNFVVLDNDYKILFPLYNYLFNFNNLFVYKKYFFLNKFLLSYNNWFYFYGKFCKKFNIVFILILDYFYFNKFFKSFKILNLPISSFFPIVYDNFVIDYPIYFNSITLFYKFIFVNYLSCNIFFFYNFKFFKIKKIFLKNFCNFKINLLN